ncbi:MAG: SUF system NifU family Fe-S cluster assembly protein [Kiritimatiellae bacterium]|nr:SUF system NifU family Fe-S cluster assembly protein [Kiritimatiellia bacterium]MDD4735849.1 SUF system NifU family Fe-S cluster assembly protein [Kiritimatiellia bacterium]
MAVDPLYQQIIMEHYRNPRGRRSIPNECPRSARDNPACGDSFSLHLALEGDLIRELMIDGNGCAVSTASCSLMAEDLVGRNVHDALQRVQDYLTALDGRDPISAEIWDDLSALDGIRHFKSRKTCAKLCWLLFRDEYHRLFPPRKEDES